MIERGRNGKIQSLKVFASSLPKYDPMEVRGRDLSFDKKSDDTAQSR